MGYIAGIIDGEGSITFHGKYRLVLVITSVNRAIVDFIRLHAKNEGARIFEGVRAGRREYYIRWDDKYAYQFLVKIQEYLVGKKEQAKLAIDFWTTKYSLDRLYGRKRKPQSAFKELEVLKHMITNLNKKPRIRKQR